MFCGLYLFFVFEVNVETWNTFLDAIYIINVWENMNVIYTIMVHKKCENKALL